MKITYTSWTAIPEGLHTKTQLRQMGFRLAKDQPVHGWKHDIRRKKDYPLYLKAEAVKYEASPEKIAAMEKARYMAEKVEMRCGKCGGYIANITRKAAQAMTESALCNRCIDEEAARDWARGMLARPAGEVLILDTETTDLNGEIIEIGVIDLAGNVLLNQRIKPRGLIAPGAQAVHGITLEMLEDAPGFGLAYLRLREITQNKTVLIYNFNFDFDMIHRECARGGLTLPKWKPDSACLMKWYAQWYGEWNRYHESYRWQRLPSGDHSAVGDCQAALRCLRQMAEITP
jgi:DNA polymerase-3 subunit epsilon